MKENDNRVIIGVKVYIRRLIEEYEEIVEIWQQDKSDKFYKVTATRKINELEVPPIILAKANKINEKVDISQDLEKELKLLF